MTADLFEASPIDAPASQLGESPFWHPDEAALYWCDIPGKRLNRFSPGSGRHEGWDFVAEPACCAPILGGDLILGMRDGLWRFSPKSGQRVLLAPAPYDPAHERFNDGKADPQGRFWVGTIYEPRDPALAHLYCWNEGRLKQVAGGVTVSNGLAWSPDGGTMYWSDTKTHRVRSFAMDVRNGELSQEREFAAFPLKRADQDLGSYGGQPDGAAVDVEGCYWTAMFEGQRLLRLSPAGEVLREVRLPVRCATMPAFGGDDLQDAFVTTAKAGRPESELALQPWAGRVLQLRVEVPGLPVNFVR